MRDDVRKNVKAGILTAVVLTLLALAVLTIGEQQQLFQDSTDYLTSFGNVRGLRTGAPVQMDGVTVGSVEAIRLPTDPTLRRVIVAFSVDEQYEDRVRVDTVTRIKTLGLLGDKFLELTGGDPDSARALPGTTLRGQDPAEVSEFISGGEDVMENVLSISSSLKTILSRVEEGEGLLGEMTSDPETPTRVTASLHETLQSLNRILERIERGEGLAGRLITEDPEIDRVLAELRGAAGALSGVAVTIADDIARDDTAYAALLKDPEGRATVVSSLASLEIATAAVSDAAESIAGGDGILPRLMADESYGDDVLEDLRGTVANIESVTAKIDRGDGAAGALVNDPQLYQDIENVVRGIERSKILSWFIRNRRTSGEEARAADEEEIREELEEVIDRAVREALAERAVEPSPRPPASGSDGGPEGPVGDRD